MGDERPILAPREEYIRDEINLNAGESITERE